MSWRLLRFRSIQAKLSALVFGLCLGLVVVPTVYFPLTRIAAARRGFESKALMYGALIGRGVESAVAFDDRETAREAFEAAAANGDADIRGLALYQEGGAPISVQGELAAPPPDVARVRSAPGLVALPGALRVYAPVETREGPRGTLVIELSTAAIDGETRATLMTGTAVAAIGLALGLVGAWLIGRSLGRRLERIERAATRIAAGHLDQQAIDDDSADEIGRLARAFGAMLGDLRRLVGEIRKAADDEHVRLERVVRDRTAELRARSDDMRRVLDSVGEGFVTIDRSGKMSAERSAILSRWFGDCAPETNVWDYLGAADPRAKAWWEVSWDSVFEDVLPRELSIDQLVKRLDVAGASYRLRYAPVEVGGAVERVLLVVSDATQEEARDRAEAREQDVLAMCRQWLRDREACVEFVAETSRLVASTQDPDATTVDFARAVHTLKGSAGLLGLRHLASLAHEVEDAVHEEGSAPLARLAALEAHWETIRATIQPFLESRSDSTIEVESHDIDELVALVQRTGSDPEVAELANRWRFQRVEPRLSHMAEQACSLAARLGKNVHVVIEPNGVRMGAGLASFWSALTHVIRNAVDHGIESREIRARLGKDPVGRLILKTRTLVGGWQVEVVDDGAGVDWNQVSDRARRLGLPHTSRRDLEDALFADGLSTRQRVSDTSGRGVGLAAVWAACREVGATAAVESSPGQGTTIRFTIPTVAKVVSVPPRAIAS